MKGRLSGIARRRVACLPVSWLFGSRRVLFGVVVVTVVMLMAIFAPDPGPCLLERSLAGPQVGAPFGYDLQGCNYLPQVMHGARTSLLIGGAVTVLASAIGIVVGGTAGFRGGWIDSLISRVTDVVFAVPAIVGALLLFGFLDKRSLILVIGVLTFFSWPPIAGLVRGSVKESKERAFVEAASALGATRTRILFRHVLPNSLRPLLAFLPPFAAGIISTEAILSFVGAGLQLPAISWGLLLENLGVHLYEAPHLIIPGVFLALLVYALVLLGDLYRVRTTL